MSISNWQSARERSRYHFDKWRTDTDAVQHLGKFIGEWQEEISQAINDARPLNWSNRREGTGRPIGDVTAEENDLITAGADPNNVIRIMVMLQDWEPGQFLMYGNQMFDRWRAGDIHTFDWQNLPHATANASLTPRPMLVVTGVKTQETRQLLTKDINIQL